MVDNNICNLGGESHRGGRGLVIYDFGARYYTPSSPRWLMMDPLAEKYYSISPYAYCAGDPVNYVDINGEWMWGSQGNLLSLPNDSIHSLAAFLGVSFFDAAQMVWRNHSDGDIARGEYILQKDNIWIESRSHAVKTINSNSQAILHYYFGKGEPADVGDYAIEQLVLSPEFQNTLNRLRSSSSEEVGSFGVDMTNIVFHIGRTSVAYSVEAGTNYNTITFELLHNDSFSDPNYRAEQRDLRRKAKSKADHLGPNYELGGKPYYYATRKRTYFFRPTR